MDYNNKYWLLKKFEFIILVLDFVKNVLAF